MSRCTRGMLGFSLFTVWIRGWGSGASTKDQVWALKWESKTFWVFPGFVTSAWHAGSRSLWFSRLFAVLRGCRAKGMMWSTWAVRRESGARHKAHAPPLVSPKAVP